MLQAKGKAYSDDLRWRIVWMKEILGMKCSKVASLGLMSERTVQRYTERFRATGGVSPFAKRDGPTRSLNEQDGSILVQATIDKPGVYLHEMQQILAGQTGTNVHSSTICRTMSRLGFTQQKIKQMPQQRSEESRIQFMAEIAAYDPNLAG